MKKPGVPKTSYVPKRESKPGEILYRWDAINHVIKSIGAKRYLEIGVCGEDLAGNPQGGECFKRIRCEHKDGVDPYGEPANYHMTSDDFFDSIDDDVMWDVIFIDAEHHPAFLTRDLNNAFKHIAKGGVVAVHDAYPNPQYFVDKHIIGGGRGIVWQTIRKFMEENRHLGIMSLAMDNGICFISERIKAGLPHIKWHNREWEFIQANINTITNAVSIAALRHQFE